jgi:FlaG/FlaF family flagellin (archaellin)
MTDTNYNQAKIQEKKKGVPGGMIALSIILAGALIFLVAMYFNQKNRMTEMETVLTQEKDSLANELRLMVASYDTLKTDNDSLNVNLQREKKRIGQLLSINAQMFSWLKNIKTRLEQ